MPRYTDELFNEIMSRNDIVDVISESVRLKRQSGDHYMGLCPFHGEKTPSFSVSRSKQLYHCFGCGRGGNVITYVSEYENIGRGEAVQRLAERVGIEVPQQEVSAQDRARATRREKLYQVNKDAATYFYQLLRKPKGQTAYDYFKRRGLTDETMQRFGLGYSDKYRDDLYRFLRERGHSIDILRDSGVVAIDEARGGYDKFWNRAMFPIMDVNNKVIAFGGRVMGEGEPKYLNSSDTDIFHKKETLYGLNLVRRTRRQEIILCEGYMDVIALHQAGFDNATASLGTAFTSGHANLLNRYCKGKTAYLSYDSDGAGVKAAMRAIPILREAGIACKVISMQPYKDPDEFIKALGAEAYQQRIDEAQNSFLFTTDVIQRDYDMTDPASKTRFFAAVAEQLLVFEEELERSNYIDAVAERYGVGVSQLRDMVNKRGTKEGLISYRQPLKSGMQKRQSGAEGMKKSQRLLLTWIAENPSLYAQVRPYIQPEDFTEGVYSQVATLLFERLDEGSDLGLSSMVNYFAEEEDQHQVAEIFNTFADGVQKPDDLSKALQETVLKIKENSLAQQNDRLDKSDAEAISRLWQEKQRLNELRNKHFSID